MKNLKIYSQILKLFDIELFVSATWEKECFLSKKHMYQKTLKFCQKNLDFGCWKVRKCKRRPEKTSKTWSIAGFEPFTSAFRTVRTLDICIIQDTNSADLISARHRQFYEKEEKRRLLSWKLFFRKKDNEKSIFLITYNGSRNKKWKRLFIEIFL